VPMEKLCLFLPAAGITATGVQTANLSRSRHSTRLQVPRQEPPTNPNGSSFIRSIVTEPLRSNSKSIFQAPTADWPGLRTVFVSTFREARTTGFTFTGTTVLNSYQTYLSFSWVTTLTKLHPFPIMTVRF